jgi:hypothetical protein
VRIDAEITPDLEQRLVAGQPWMHTYRLADDVVVGLFKDVVGADTTACVSSSPPAVIEAMTRAFEQHMAKDPGYELRELVSRVGADGSYLDIASASGWQSLSSPTSACRTCSASRSGPSRCSRRP